MSQEDDQELAAFRGVYRDHFHDVLRYAFRRTLRMELAEELTQEVFLVAWRRRRAVRRLSLPWLYGVARRLLANHWRARRAGLIEVPLGTLATPACGDDYIDAVDTLQDLARAFARLSEGDQEVIRLLAWEGLTSTEVAEVLGCGRAAAAVKVHRARRRLRRHLDQGSAAESVKVVHRSVVARGAR